MSEITPEQRSWFEQMSDVLNVAWQEVETAVSSAMPDVTGVADPDEPQPTVTAPDGPPAQNPEPRRVNGQGGYVYEQYPDGSIVIVDGPTSVGSRVSPDSTAGKAITDEIGPFPHSDSPSSPPQADPPADPPHDLVPDSPSDTPLPPVAADLEELMAKETLTTEEVGQARALIAKEPADAQGVLYEQLQEKIEYSNQRNNDTSLETDSGGTCNLASVAMAFAYLGVKNPYPEMDFDEALVKIATDEKMGSITSSSCWGKLAEKFGKVMEYVDAGIQKRSWWESKIDNGYLKKGYGVIMSLDGHVVRLEAINELGLVVDDPYDASKLSGRTFDDGRPKYSFEETNSRSGDDASSQDHSGEDNGYPWVDVEKYTFKYIIAFK